MQKVKPSRGWYWISRAVSITLSHPGVFPVMGLIMAALYLIPLLGGLVLMVLGPALTAGTIVAARDAAEGRKPRVGQLFTLFQEEGRLSDAIKLCIPVVVGDVIASIIIGIAVMGILTRAGLDLKTLSEQPDVVLHTLQQAGDGLALWILAALLVLVIAWAFLVCAIPRVALQRAEPFSAMAGSFRLALRNAGAWLVAGLTLALGSTLLFMLAGMTGQLLLAELLVYAVTHALGGPLLYVAWSDLHADPEEAPIPPKPPHTLEA